MNEHQITATYLIGTGYRIELTEDHGDHVRLLGSTKAVSETEDSRRVALLHYGYKVVGPWTYAGPIRVSAPVVRVR